MVIVRVVELSPIKIISQSPGYRESVSCEAEDTNKYVYWAENYFQPAGLSQLSIEQSNDISLAHITHHQ